MDEMQKILLSSLESSGISLPSGVSSTIDIDSAALVSLCSQFLNLIRAASTPFPTALPDSSAERLKLCTDIALAVKSSDYPWDLSFRQFLYPSTEDVQKLVRFFVKKLSELAEEENVCGGKTFMSSVEVGDDASCVTELPLPKMSSKPDGDSLAVSNSNIQIYESVAELEQGLDVLQGQTSKVSDKIQFLHQREMILMSQVKMKNLKAEKLQGELQILKEAVDIVFDDKHSPEVYIENLDMQIQEKYKALESKWVDSKDPSRVDKTNEDQELDGKKKILMLQKKLSQLKEVEQDAESIMSEIQKREEELSILRSDLQRLPRLPSRKSYIERIIEFTKNSRKQDADIERILCDTRELQKESNSVEERLHRTYTVANEAMLRGSKDDPVRRQAHQLLTNIHDNFQQISYTILATDRVRRETAEQEAKLAVISSHSFNIAKLKADLDAIRKENEILDRQLQNTSF